MSYQPPLPPKPTPSPQRRPTYGSYPNDYENPPQSPPPEYPRRRPVPPRPSAVDNSGSRRHKKQDSYGAPPVSPVNGSARPFEYDWPQAAQSAASGYADPKSTLVYPEEAYMDSPPPPPLPPPPPKRNYSRNGDGYVSPTEDIYGERNSLTQGINDMNLDRRPLPRPLPRSPYPPKLQVSPWEEQYSQLSPTYPNDRYHSPEQDCRNDPFRDPYQRPVRRSSSAQDVPNILDMPLVPAEFTEDSLHPLPATPKSPSFSHSPEMKPNYARRQSNPRPATRSSTSSMFSYTQDRPIDSDYYEDNDNESATSPTSYHSLGRTGTMLPVERRPSQAGLRLDTEDLPPPIPPPPPPYVQLTEPSSPPHHARSNSFSSSPPIYRSRTEPGHYRSSSTEPTAPTPPPKLPLQDGQPKYPASLGVLRSQSHSAVTKALPRSPSHPATKFEKDTSATLKSPEENPLSPITDSKTFPLSSKLFQRCKEPWSLSALRNWMQEIFGNSVSMEDISLALQGLFTHHVSTLSVQQADKLATQVGTTWVREGVLFEPTVANTALWNPLSTLEMGFTPFVVEGVLPTLTGKGCYSPSCAASPPGRCYSHRCSRTLAKKSGLPPPPSTIPHEKKKAADWVSFWSLDEEFLRGLDKREIKRQNVIYEFIQNEEEYVGDLNTLLNLFQKQVIAASSTPMPIVLPNQVDQFLKKVFGHVKPILDWQMKKLLVPLRERQTQQGPVIRGVGDLVIEWARGCREIYTDYAGGYPFANLLVRDASATSPAFVSWLERCQSDPVCRRLPLDHFLQAPTRKIQRVLLLIDKIIETTEETNRDRETLTKAATELRNIAHECDERTGEAKSNLDRADLDSKLVFKPGQKVDLGLQEATRKVIHQGEVSRKSDNKLDWLHIHLILMDNYLIMTKKKMDRGVEKLFVSKQPIPLDLLVLEGVTGDAVSKSTATKLVGTMTTTVSVPQQPLSRVKSEKKVNKVSSPGSGPASPDLTLVTSLTAPPTDKALIYPFSITYLSVTGDTYTLYADTPNARQTWVDKIMEAKMERALAARKIEPFEAKIVAESVFGNTTTVEQWNAKPPAVVEHSTMHRALTTMRAEPFGSRTLGKAITWARINCAKSFIAPEGTDFAHQRLVAVGTDDGVYIGYLPELSGLCTQWAKVLQTKDTTMIDVMEEFGVFLVLASKELIAYPLNSMIPQLSATTGIHPPPMARQPQRLSGNASVGFFATGKLKERMLVLYKKRGGVNSIFKALEPVVGKADTNRRNLFSRRRAQTEFFRDYDEFFVAAECFSVFIFKSTIAIPTQKGFEVLSLDEKDAPETIPDLSRPHMAHLARRLDGTKALGMYRISETEFLLCYDECAIYVDKHCEVSRSKIINWHGKPRATQVIDGKYVLAFDPSFVEIWRCAGEFGEGGVSLVQIIPGRDIRMIGKEEKKADLGLGPGTGYYDRVYIAMAHPERTDRQIVVELAAQRF